MTTPAFLEEWDWAIESALIHGKPGCLWELEEDPDGGRYPLARLMARTMHPSFMSGPVPKWDPRRDK